VFVDSLLNSFALDFHCFHEFALEALNLYFYFLEFNQPGFEWFFDFLDCWLQMNVVVS